MALSKSFPEAWFVYQKLSSFRAPELQFFSFQTPETVKNST
jgi:hypothetical protein